MNKNSSKNTSGILWIAAVVSMVLAVAALPAAADDGGGDPNPEQSGTNTACDHLNGLYLVEQDVVNPLAVVQVEGASGYVTTSSSGFVYIFFQNSNGQSIELHEGPSGVTPGWARTGVICVARESPVVPTPPNYFVTEPEVGATWTYQDGF